jgi:hypothetical protein
MVWAGTCSASSTNCRVGPPLFPSHDCIDRCVRRNPLIVENGVLLEKLPGEAPRISLDANAFPKLCGLNVAAVHFLPLPPLLSEEKVCLSHYGHSGGDLHQGGVVPSFANSAFKHQQLMLLSHSTLSLP